MHGRKWKTIASELDRTPINVRDKYKSMGEEAHALRDKDFWTIGEILKLIRLIEKKVKVKLLSDSVTEEKLLKKLENTHDVVYHDATRKKNRGFAFDKKLVIFIFLSKYSFFYIFALLSIFY